MPIQRRSSRSLESIGAGSRANAVPLQHFAIAQKVADKQKMLAAIQFLFAEEDRKAREKKAEEKGGGMLGAGAGGVGGAALGFALGGPVGMAVGASLGASTGQLAGEMIDPAGSPEAARSGQQLASGISTLAPLAGGVAGGFKGISPHESGTWSEQFGKGFSGTMNDMQKWSLEHPYAANAAGMPTAGLFALPSARYAPPPEMGNSKMTSPGEAGYAPPVKFGPPPSPAMGGPRQGSYAPQWFNQPYAPQWFNQPSY